MLANKPEAALQCLTCVYPWCMCSDVPSCLAHIVLEDAQALAQAAQCGCRCGFE